MIFLRQHPASPKMSSRGGVPCCEGIAANLWETIVLIAHYLAPFQFPFGSNPRQPERLLNSQVHGSLTVFSTALFGKEKKLEDSPVWPLICGLEAVGGEVMAHLAYGDHGVFFPKTWFSLMITTSPPRKNGKVEMGKNMVPLVVKDGASTVEWVFTSHEANVPFLEPKVWQALIEGVLMKARQTA